MTIQITRLRPDTITGEGYDWTRMGYVEDDGRVILKDGEDRTKLGIFDKIGYVYDDDRHRVGHIDDDGRIYDENRNRIGKVETWGNWAVVVVDRDGHRVAHAEPWGHDRYSFSWLSKAAGAGWILLVIPADERWKKRKRDLGINF